MTVLERSELESSPLADLHAIADQLGLEGFRRLRKADLIDAILGEKPRETDAADASAAEEEAQRARKRRRRRRSGGAGAARHARAQAAHASRLRRRGGRRREGRGGASLSLGRRAGARRRRRLPRARTASRGVVEVLGNGSAFLRVSPPEPSDEDVYISAAQVRRCELVSGDEVSGPVRTPRRSERYPSLVRIDTINGAPADAVSDGSRYEDLPVAWPAERLALGSGDPTLEAIEWLTPLGLGSRAVIVGGRQRGEDRDAAQAAGRRCDVARSSS